MRRILGLVLYRGLLAIERMWPCRRSHDQFRAETKALCTLAPRDLADKEFSRFRAHVAERLANSGQRRVCDACELDIVETHDRDIFRNFVPRFLQCGHGAEGGDVIVGNQRGKTLAATEQLLRSNAALVDVALESLQLNREARIYSEAKVLASCKDRFPAIFRVAVSLRSFDEGNLPVAKAGG